MESSLLSRFFWEENRGEVLDIGCGHGRNSIFLSQKGYNVTAIDKDKKNIDIFSQEIADKKINNISLITADVRDFNFQKSFHDLIIANYSIIFLKLSEIEEVVEKIKMSVKNNGFVYFSVFSTDDPTCKKLKQKIKPIEKNTFFIESKKFYRHFFTKKELLDFFIGWEIIVLEEKTVNEEDSVYGRHQHEILEIIVKKRDE